MKNLVVIVLFISLLLAAILSWPYHKMQFLAAKHHRLFKKQMALYDKLAKIRKQHPFGRK